MNNENRRKQILCILSFIGTGYYGSQTNPEFPSIENSVFKAFKAAKLLHEKSLAESKINLKRVSRTDRGVHAAYFVLSLRVFTAFEMNEIKKFVVPHLPSTIKLHEVLHIGKRFNLRKSCVGRVYRYVIPIHNFDSLACAKLFGFYLGTKNFHNFTNTKNLKKNASFRYIKKIDIDFTTKVFDTGFELAKTTEKLKGLESSVKRILNQVIWQIDLTKKFEVFQNKQDFLIVTLEGQSFMKQQIRKMIALIVCIIYFKLDPNRINEAFGKSKINIPIAPAHGLYLKKMVFLEKGNEVGNRLNNNKALANSMHVFEKEIIAKAITSDAFRKDFQEWLNYVEKNKTKFDLLF